MRIENRRFDELRNIEIIPDYNLYAEGSCLIKCGNTHVLCSASVEAKTPQWLKDENKGWITAEYSLLPRSTMTRVSRERNGPSGRTHEIQRLIGRSLRAIVNLEKLAGYTITIDCDVIQADGGTRTASITGGYVALYLALRKMVSTGKIPSMPINEAVAAISVGICHNDILLDLNYEEDSSAQADTNFVLTQSGKIIEIQCTAEQSPFGTDDFQKLFELAKHGIQLLIQKQQEAIRHAKL